MELAAFKTNIFGLSFALELAAAVFCLVLTFGTITINTKTKETKAFFCFLFLSFLSMFTDLIAWVLHFNSKYVTLLIIFTILSYCISLASAVAIYIYFEQYYSEFVKVKVNKGIKYLVIVIALFSIVFYIVLVLKGIVFKISPSSQILVSNYSLLSSIGFMIIIAICLWLVLKHINKTDYRHSIIYIIYAISSIITIIIDSRYLTTFHTIVVATFGMLVLIFIQVETEKDLEKKSRLLLESEINALRLQMNPHFIYNTLASIDGLCMIDPKGARKLIRHFVKHLRSSYLDVTDVLIPFKKELENLESYIAIEQTRFPMLSVDYDIKVSEFRIPPCTLQPIVENAIKHGIRAKEDAKGFIRISTYEMKDFYSITISDNGIGFEVTTSKEDDGHNHIGIENTRRRIEIICHGIINIKSEKELGTIVDILLPKEEK